MGELLDNIDKLLVLGEKFSDIIDLGKLIKGLVVSEELQRYWAISRIGSISSYYLSLVVLSRKELTSFTNRERKLSTVQ